MCVHAAFHERETSFAKNSEFSLGKVKTLLLATQKEKLGYTERNKNLERESDHDHNDCVGMFFAYASVHMGRFYF